MNLAPGPAVDTVAEDMAAFGVKDFTPPDWMLEEPLADESFGVLPENWDAVALFLACGTQWLRENGVPCGLRYEGIDVLLRRSSCDQPDDVFARLRVMEAAAVREFRRLAAEREA